MLHPLGVHALVAASVLPNLPPLPMLQVYQPFAFILCPVYMSICAESVGFVLFPLSVKDVAISVPENATSLGFVILPAALILGSIWPNLDTEAVTHVL